MNYPFWEVPYLGSQLMIAIIAVIHVYISHFAIGGGFYLPIAEKYFSKQNNPGFMDYLKKHARFFLIITGVFGALSGVGIWFTIGLTNPETTSSLIHTFVFAWAIEWVFFLVEIVSIIFYYYTFDFMSRRNHIIIGWIYLVSAWLSLFVINGILTYMLTPGDWLTTKSIWDGFFNPTFFPSLFVRTFAMLMLITIFTIFTATRIKEDDLREKIVRFNTKWIIPVIIGMVISLVWYYFMLPDDRQLLLTLGFSGIGPGNLSILTRLVTIGFITFILSILVIFFGPFLNPRNFRTSIAVLLLIMGFIIVGTFEFSRETLRKPFTIVDYIYSNSTRVNDKDKYLKEGLLKNIKWTDIKEITPENKLKAGRQIFLNQCQACHTKERYGYRSVVDLNLKAERNKEAIKNFVELIKSNDPNVNMYLRYMPQFLGNDKETDALIEYINSLVEKYNENK